MSETTLQQDIDASGGFGILISTSEDLANNLSTDKSGFVAQDGDLARVKTLIRIARGWNQIQTELAAARQQAEFFGGALDDARKERDEARKRVGELEARLAKTQDTLQKSKEVLESSAGIIIDIRARLERAVGALKMAECPNCDGSGGYPIPPHGECEQCQWCSERKAVLAAEGMEGS